MEQQNEPKPVRLWLLITLAVVVLAAIGFFIWNNQQNKKIAAPVAVTDNTSVVSPTITSIPAPTITTAPAPITKPTTTTPATTTETQSTSTKNYSATLQAESMGTNCDSATISFNYPNNYKVTTTKNSSNANLIQTVSAALANPTDSDFIQFPSYSEKTQQEMINIQAGADSTGGCGGPNQWTAFYSDYNSLLGYYQKIAKNSDSTYQNIIAGPKKVNVNNHEAIQFTYQNKSIYTGTPSNPINPGIMNNTITKKTVIANANEPSLNIEMSKTVTKQDNGDGVYPDISFTDNALSAYDTVVDSLKIQ